MHSLTVCALNTAVRTTSQITIVRTAVFMAIIAESSIIRPSLIYATIPEEKYEERSISSNWKVGRHYGYSDGDGERRERGEIIGNMRNLPSSVFSLRTSRVRSGPY